MSHAEVQADSSGERRGAAASFATKEEAIAYIASLAGRVTRRLVGPLEIGLGIGLVVPLRPTRVYYVDAAGSQQELFRMGAVAGVVDVGLGVGFP